MKEKITVSTLILKDINSTWAYFTEASHIKNWYFADPSWHVREASNDVKVSGEFHIYMEAKDQSFGFDFYGIYHEIIPYSKLSSTLGDGRKLEVTFLVHGEKIEVIETFEAEEENSIELQRQGWQAILDEFKRYCESR
jgi:uncharacterized protein YndB with AHSA1/START domain